MFELEINPKPKLKKIVMKCDSKIDKKLDKIPLFKDNLNCANTTLFIGLQGSGKTSLCINFLTCEELYFHCFENVYVFMRETSMNSLENNIFENLDSGQKFEELNYENLMFVYEKIKENSLLGEMSLIIYDDVQEAMKDKMVVRLLKNMVANQRHLRLVNFILLQNFYNLDITIRRIITNVIFFKLDKGQLEQIQKDIFEVKKEEYDDLIKFVFDEQYNWFFYNKKVQHMYKNFDKIIIKKN